MKKDDDFDKLLNLVLEKIEEENENNEDILYYKFLESDQQNIYKPNEDFRRKLIQITKSNHEQNILQKQANKGVFLPRWATVVITVIMSAMLFVIVAQAAGINLLQIRSTETHTEIKISPEMNEKYLAKLEETWGIVYFPQYIPEGYILTDITERSLSITTEFRSNNDILSIKQFKATENNISFLDTECSDYETLTFKEASGVLSQKNGLNVLYYYRDQDAFVISGHINRQEILMLAESLK